MPVNFNDLFRKLGQLGSQVNYVNAFRGPLEIILTDMMAAYYSNDKPLIDGLYSQLNSFQNSCSGLLSYLSTLASATVIADVNAVTSLPDRSLSTALNELLNQMVAYGQTIVPNAISTFVNANTDNHGRAAWVVSTKTRTGQICANTFQEYLTAIVINDAQVGGTATVNREPVQIKGTVAVADTLSWTWPGGSGSNATIRAVDAAQQETPQNGNWLANGNFEDWPAPNTPDSWVVNVGTIGTQILQSSISCYGLYSLAFVGDSATHTSIYQGFGEETTITFPPLTQVAFNLWARCDIQPAAGVLQIALVDGNGNIIDDEAGTPNVVTQSLAPLSFWGYGLWGSGTWGNFDGGGEWGALPWGAFLWGIDCGNAYTPIGASFRTPSYLPENIRLQISLSTPLSTGSTLTIDRVCLTLPTQLYTQGPSVAIFSGPLPLIKGDNYSFQFLNNENSGFQQLFNRFFNTPSLGQLLPVGYPPNIPDFFGTQQQLFDGMTGGGPPPIGSVKPGSGGGGFNPADPTNPGGGFTFNPGGPTMPSS